MRPLMTRHQRFLSPVFWCLFAAISSWLPAEEVKTLRLEPAANMDRAELHYVKTVDNPRAVLILCPGCNGSGESLIRSDAWISFAKEQRLGLVGLSFSSPMPAIHDGTGYYYASKGSGEVLLKGIREIYGRDLPLLLFGFSGGAHFTSRFEQWNPSRVLSWCAYSAGWWDEPRPNAIAPPGIVACGDEDPRYGASLIYLKQGRAAGKPWLWVSLPKTRHSGSASLDEFVRYYFKSVLSHPERRAAWIDIDREVEVDNEFAKKVPTLAGWIPSRALVKAWQDVHAP